MSFLLYGSTGWIGGELIKILKKDGNTVYSAKSRIENRYDVEQELLTFKPKYVLLAAGLTGRPNVDWCESHKQEVIRVNVIGALNVVDLCYIHKIHLTIFNTGCIYNYDEKHTIGGKPFTEEDEPNFGGSFYSHTKRMFENMIKSYDNLLNLRIRMPLNDDLEQPRNFVTKITKYAKLINIPNSMTILDDLLPIAVEMTKKELKGIYNFTNPGTVSHNEILELYKQYIDPSFKWQNFTIEEQNKILMAPRSNNALDTSKLQKEFPNVPPVKDSLVRVFERMQNRLNEKKSDHITT